MTWNWTGHTTLIQRIWTTVKMRSVFTTLTLSLPTLSFGDLDTFPASCLKSVSKLLKYSRGNDVKTVFDCSTSTFRPQAFFKKTKLNLLSHCCHCLFNFPQMFLIPHGANQQTKGILWPDYIVERNVAQNVRAMTSQQRTAKPSTTA